MIASMVARRQYAAGLTSLEQGDLDGLLRHFASKCTLTFVGDTPLGADHLTGPALRLWFERFLRLLPDRRFEVQRVVVTGPPWNQQLAAHVLIHSSISGEPYTNQFAHFLRIRWAKVVDDLVLEDTQRWDRACRQLTAEDVPEAGAAPISSRQAG